MTDEEVRVEIRPHVPGEAVDGLWETMMAEVERRLGHPIEAMQVAEPEDGTEVMVFR